ncbi:MAG: histidine ammonia-lyase [Flavobacteriales bacterium]|nr:histidine ammonia-lyase [Flavobacteriales bacterium]|tara:strand:- start:3393 stop:4886 length:1494 start_codon:yes stop_codon:yes gene_type:complete
MYKIDNSYLTLEKLYKIINEQQSIELSNDATLKIIECRSFLDKQSDNSTPIYGVNTGFGSLCNESISKENLEELQVNLVISHACGFGEEVPLSVVKLMLFLKIKSLSFGYSGVQLDTVNRLIDFYNEDILPVVYQQGSLGASGDLAPLAHLSLPLIGMGEVYYKGQKVKSEHVLKEMAWKPICLKSKEGLALLNGTQFMSAYAIHSLFKSYKLSYLADLISSISLEAFDGRIEPFNELIHLIRPHRGQAETAKNISEFLDGSSLIKQEKVNVQDPYSLRCIPQVHGATKDALEYAKNTIVTEINSVTDNPNVFAKEGKVISAGNFHGQPLALVMDHMSIALSELGSISERRIYLLVSGQRGLPPYLTPNVGLNSGFMIPQYTAASIASQNKQLCTPASVDSIVSSNGQEDHVSMGANAATKLYVVTENIERILSIELMTSSQALSFRTKKSSDFIENFVNSFRQEVAVLSKDVLLYDEMKKSQQFIQNLSLDESLIC